MDYFRIKISTGYLHVAREILVIMKAGWTALETSKETKLKRKIWFVLKYLHLKNNNGICKNVFVGIRLIKSLR